MLHWMTRLARGTFAGAALLVSALASVAALAVPALRNDAPQPNPILVREDSSDFSPVAHPEGGPSRILLMRHADKTGDRDDEDLSPEGVARARQLADYIPKTFGKPDFIIATAPSKHSNRPAETVEPLAAALGMRVEQDLKNKEFEVLANDVFSNPVYRGKTLVICWHHGNIPALATLLGAPAGTYPNPWPDDTYNLILDFRYDPNSGAPPTVTQVAEPF